MYIDGKLRLSVYGVNPLGHTLEEDPLTGTRVKGEEEGGRVQMGVYTRNAHLVPLDDVFNPPSTHSTITDVE